MATVKNIRISRNFYKTGNEDLVQFSINELDKSYMWCTSIRVPCGTSEEECQKLAEEEAEKITESDINDYRRFLCDGETYGWD